MPSPTRTGEGLGEQVRGLVHTHVKASMLTGAESRRRRPADGPPEPEDVSPVWRSPASSARPIVVHGGEDAVVRVWDPESRELLHPPLASGCSLQLRYPNRQHRYHRRR